MKWTIINMLSPFRPKNEMIHLEIQYLNKLSDEMIF